MGSPRKLLLLFVSLVHFCGACNSADVSSHLASKSPYRFVANADHDIVKYNGCEPLKIWMLVRHGTRNPSKKYIESMDNRLTLIRNHIVKNRNDLLRTDVEAFQKWTNKLSSSDEKKLTHEGETEMVGLAERMQRRYPKLLPNVYNSNTYKFRFTHTQRTKASARYFTVGLFGKATAKDISFPEPTKKDPLLRFYKLCNKWNKEVKKNPQNLIERQRFQATPTVKQAALSVQRRIGNFSGLTLDDVHTMYTACAFETAWSQRNKSPWCTIFDTDTAKVFEYLEDLKYYYQDGYAHEISYKQACPPLADMIKFMEATDNLKSTVYFSHSGAMLKVLAHLGMFDDKRNLTAENFGKARQWRSGQIGPFGSNLAFIKHRCGNAIKLEVRHQERVVRLPVCPDSDLCDLKVFKEYYADSIDHCNLDRICENNAAPGA